jgi:AraC-like DNA-binding protein
MMSSPLSLTEIAHAANYFDQAHFCRDFKEISGITPSEYREKVGPAPGHIFTP